MDEKEKSNLNNNGGKENKKITKKWWFWLIIVLVIIGVIIALSGKDNGSSNSSPKPDSSKSTTKVKTEYKVGEEINVSGKKLTVTDVKKSSGKEYNIPDAGKEFVIVTVKFENTSDNTLSYNAYDFKLQDSNGVIQGPDLSGEVLATKTGINSGELAKGGKVEGTVGFQAPKGDKDLTLIYEGLFGLDQVKIKLQ